jgi:hypothetical protein
LTTLTAHTGKVLFNTALGDTARLSTRACDCEFGRAGLRTRLSNVRSQQRLTLEGMTVAASDFEAALEDAIAALQLPSDGAQYRREVTVSGIERLVIAISPTSSQAPEESLILRELFAGMRRRGPALTLAADVWSGSGTVQVRPEELPVSGNGKSSLRSRTDAMRVTGDVGPKTESVR